MIPGTSTSKVISSVSAVCVFITKGGGVPSPLNGEIRRRPDVDLWEISPKPIHPPARHRLSRDGRSILPTCVVLLCMQV